MSQVVPRSLVVLHTLSSYSLVHMFDLHTYHHKKWLRQHNIKNKYKSTVDTSDQLWQASSIWDIHGSDLCIRRMDPRYTRKCTRTSHMPNPLMIVAFLCAPNRRYTPHVFNFLRTSQSLGQILPPPICGIQHLRLWIPRSDVWQNAAQGGPNPSYRRTGPNSEIQIVRDIDEGL